MDSSGFLLMDFERGALQSTRQFQTRLGFPVWFCVVAFVVVILMMAMCFQCLVLLFGVVSGLRFCLEP